MDFRAEVVLLNAATDIEVVAYDAIGYRAAELAARLRTAGFTQVRCLDGAIFQWANEHRPLVRNGYPVTRVHPHTQYWGRLLSDDVRGSL